MSRSFCCPKCGKVIANCGHEPGGLTSPVHLTASCCGESYSFSCDGSCLRNPPQKDEKKG